MKKTLFFCLMALHSFGQNKEVNLDSKIDKVTVFLAGAQVVRSAKTSLLAGKTTLRFQHLSAKLDPNSIQLKAEGTTIVSVKHEINYLDSPTKPQEIAKLQTQKEGLEDKLAANKSMLTVYKREEEMLVKNQAIVGQQSGLKAFDLKESVDFQRLRMSEVLTKQLDLDKTIKKLEKEMAQLDNQINQVAGTRGEDQAEIVVTVLNNTAAPASFAITYFVSDANWTPSYDLRVKDISKPLNLAFKASINQHTGEDWKEVSLSLSTGEPQSQGVAPTLSTWYLEEVKTVKALKFLAPEIKRDEEVKRMYPPDNHLYNPNVKEINGTITDEQGNPLSGVNVLFLGSGKGVSTNKNGYFSIQVPEGATAIQISSVGYLSRRLTIFQMNMSTQLFDDHSSLEEVVSVGYGSRLQGRVAGFIPIADANEIDLSANTNYQQTVKSFDLSQHYTINDGNDGFQVELKTAEIPATYEYYVAPKYDKDAYLTAKVVDWEKYDLMEGNMKLYFEDTYLGDSYLDVSNKDTLTISLGKDKGVLVTRTKSSDFRKKQSLGSNKTDSRAYDIVVRNMKRQAINLIVEDQFPISKSKEIEILDQEAPEAEVNKEIGKLSWKFSLEPNKEKKVHHQFSVKSPKAMVLSLD